MGGANAKVGRETVHQPTISKHSLHESTNKNGFRLVDFAAGRQMACTNKSTLKPGTRQTFNQIDHCLIVRRHFLTS
jgi:hypothetical protein